jgi:hypothetical protein
MADKPSLSMRKLIPISKDNLSKIDDWIPYLNWGVQKGARIEEFDGNVERESPVALLIQCIDSQFAV